LEGNGDGISLAPTAGWQEMASHNLHEPSLATVGVDAPHHPLKRALVHFTLS